MNHFKIPKTDRLRIPINFRPLDFIVLGLITIQFFWSIILYAEISDLREIVHRIQVEARP